MRLAVVADLEAEVEWERREAVVAVEEVVIGVDKLEEEAVGGASNALLVAM